MQKSSKPKLQPILEQYKKCSDSHVVAILTDKNGKQTIRKL